MPINHWGGALVVWRLPLMLLGSTLPRNTKREWLATPYQRSRNLLIETSEVQQSLTHTHAHMLMHTHMHTHAHTRTHTHTHTTHIQLKTQGEHGRYPWKSLLKRLSRHLLWASWAKNSTPVADQAVSGGAANHRDVQRGGWEEEARRLRVAGWWWWWADNFCHLVEECQEGWHGGSSIPTRLAGKQEVMSEFLDFVDANSQPNGRQAGSYSAQFFFLPKFTRIATPREGEKNYDEKSKSSVVTEFNRVQRENGRQTSASTAAIECMKKHRSKVAIHPSMTDYCDTCKYLKEQLSRNQAILNRQQQSGSTPEAELAKMNLKEEHKDTATKAREYYKVDTVVCHPATYQHLQTILEWGREAAACATLFHPDHQCRLSAVKGDTIVGKEWAAGIDLLPSKGLPWHSRNSWPLRGQVNSVPLWRAYWSQEYQPHCVLPHPPLAHHLAASPLEPSFSIMPLASIRTSFFFLGLWRWWVVES